MRYAASLVLLLLIAACGQRAIDDPEPKLYHQAPASPNTGAGLAPKAAPTIDGKAIVILRARYEAPNNDEYKALSVHFSTQSIDTPYAGRVLFAAGDYDQANHLWYRSDENIFLAMAVEPGTYRYISATVGDPAWRWPRFSPTKRLEFTVEAGEAVYVGDLRVYFTADDIHQHENAFGTVTWNPRTVDYRFAVGQDEAAAEAFYNSLSIENAPPLEVRLMTNEPMPHVETYANPNCNGFFDPRWSSRGFCK